MLICRQDILRVLVSAMYLSLYPMCGYLPCILRREGSCGFVDRILKIFGRLGGWEFLRYSGVQVIEVS